MKFSKSIIVLNILVLLACASKDSREGRILEVADNNSSNESKFDKYLVNKALYTTGGKKYHDKFYKYLIGIAAIVIEEKGMNISERSIGFYYDKKKNVKNELFLGLDVKVPVDSIYTYSSFREVAVVQLKKYLKEILYILHSCKSIFTEDEIAGIVVGISWLRDKSDENINIWIDKKDVIQFEKNKLTFTELIIRNTTTNTTGKIINLPI